MQRSRQLCAQELTFRHPFDNIVGAREHGRWNGQLACPAGRVSHGIRAVHATG